MTLDYKDVEIRKSELVAKTKLLCIFPPNYIFPANLKAYQS